MDVGQDVLDTQEDQPKTPATQLEDISCFNSLLDDDDTDSLATIDDDRSHDSLII